MASDLEDMTKQHAHDWRSAEAVAAGVRSASNRLWDEANTVQLQAYATALINKERQTPVSTNSDLDQVAQARAQEMANEDCVDKRCLAHVDNEGRGPSDRVKAAHIDCSWIGENWGASAGLPPELGIEKVHDHFMSEPADDPQNHRANILNPHFNEVGNGVALIPQKHELIFVTDFCGKEP